MGEEKQTIVTKKMMAFALIAPFLFCGIGMLIAYFTTINKPQNIQKIALIIATFLGLFIAISSIFLIQIFINKKIKRLNQKE